MRRRMMKSKIHRATVTDANLHYVGSITLDTDLMARADIREYEQVHVLDIDNGARFETYAIPGGPGRRLPQRRRRPSGAARATGSSSSPTRDYDDAELEDYEPAVVHVDAGNRPVTLDEADRPSGPEAIGADRARAIGLIG